MSPTSQCNIAAQQPRLMSVQIQRDTQTHTESTPVFAAYKLIARQRISGMWGGRRLTELIQGEKTERDIHITDMLWIPNSIMLMPETVWVALVAERAPPNPVSFIIKRREGRKHWSPLTKHPLIFKFHWPLWILRWISRKHNVFYQLKNWGSNS